MTSILIDVGRHKLRFGLMNRDDVITHYHAVDTADAIRTWDSFTALVRDVAEREFGVKVSDQVVVAIATPGPFRGDRFAPIGMPDGADEWFDSSATTLREALSEQMYVVHDMAACAMSISQLREEDVVPLLPPLSPGDQSGNGSQPNPSTLYIQTSIGVGVSALIPLPNGGRLPFSSEGWCDTVAPHPTDEDEREVYAGLVERDARDKTWGFISALSILSAPTLATIYEILGGKRISHEEVTSRAAAGDETAVRAVRVYIGFLGTFAGTMALSFRAYDGVYIGGPIPAAIGAFSSGNAELFNDMQQRFRMRFAERETLNEQLIGVPVTLVQNEQNTLLGLRDLLRGMGREAR